jgi:hypothetical protein
MGCPPDWRAGGHAPYTRGRNMISTRESAFAVLLAVLALAPGMRDRVSSGWDF